MLAILKKISAVELRWLGILSAAAALSAIALDFRVALWSSSISAPAVLILSYITETGLSIWYLVPSLVLFIVFLLLNRFSFRLGISRFFRWGAEACAFIFVSIFLSGLVVNIIKTFVGRARPTLYFENGILGLNPPALEASWRSFPSGHASTLIALALALGFILPRYRVHFVVIGALLASTRVFINVHFVSDVLFGGAVALLTTACLHRWFADKNYVFRALKNAIIELKPEAKVFLILVSGVRQRSRTT